MIHQAYFELTILGFKIHSLQKYLKLFYTYSLFKKFKIILIILYCFVQKYR